MGTSYPEIWNALAAEFDPANVKERWGDKAKTFKVTYISARTVANRLDEVFGFENWWDAYERDPMGGPTVFCRLTVRLPDGSTVTKSDCGPPGRTGDEGNDVKGAVSNAFKRAASKFGVGRYLYREGVFTCHVASKGQAAAARPAPVAALPAPAAPPAPSAPPRAEAPPPDGERAGGGKPPRTGRQLFGWAKDQEARHEVGLIKYLNSWAKLQDFPGRMVDWSDDQARQGHAEAVRKLLAIRPVASAPFKDPAGFREWAEARMAGDRAYSIATDLRFPGSWLTWTQGQCVEVWRALMEDQAEGSDMQHREPALAG